MSDIAERIRNRIIEERDAAGAELAAAHGLLKEARLRMAQDGWLPGDSLIARIDAVLEGDGDE